MIHRNLTSLNDWAYGKGKSDFTTGLDAVRLNIKTRLQSWRNDCFFALNEGVDYNNYLSVGTKVLLDQDIKRVILQSDGVLSILFYESILDREDRQLSVSVEISTIFGVLDLVEEEKTLSPNDYVIVNKLIPDGTEKKTPDGLFKLVFVRRTL